MDAEVKRKRDPFDDEELMRVRPVDALCERMDWLREQQIMLSVGTQGVITSQGKVESALKGASTDLWWLKLIVGVPCFLSLVVLLRVLWVLWPATMEPLAHVLAMVAP